MNSNPFETYGLSERDMTTITGLFEQYHEVDLVHLFGSRAKGNFKKGSDIDLAIMNDGVSLKTLTHLISDFAESSLPYFVDLVDFTGINNPDFVEHIQRIGIPIYERSNK